MNACPWLQLLTWTGGLRELPEHEQANSRGGYQRTQNYPYCAAYY
jgi:hypothetical protein